MSGRLLVSLAAVLVVAACGGSDLVLPGDRVAANIAVVAGNNQAAVAGSPLPDPVAVLVTDASDHPVENQLVTFTVTAGGGSVSDANVRTDESGRASTRWTLGPAAGSQTLQAKAVGDGAPDNLIATATATAGAGTAATLTLVSGDGQSGVAGAPLADPLVVEARDAANNVVPGVIIEWTVTGGGTVTEATTQTGADGRGSNRRTLGATVGAQTAVATASGVGTPITFRHTAIAGTAGRLAIDRQPPTSAQSGQAFAPPPRVQLQDVNGNPVRQAGVAISAAIASGPLAGTLIGSSTAATDANGLATFTGLGLSGPAGEYFLSFFGTSITGVTSNGVQVAAGAPARLGFVVQPSTTTAGAAITPPVQVAVLDAQGNVIPTATNAIALALGNPQGATLSGTLTRNAAAGVATFNDLSVDRNGAGYALVATSTGLTTATSDPFGVGTGSAARLAMVTQPSSSAASGQVFPQQPAVRLQDGAGNNVAEAGRGVTVSIASGGGTLGGTAAATTDANGVATFAGLSIAGSAGPRTLRFESTGLTPVTSATIAIGAGAAGSIAVNAGNNQSAAAGAAVPIDPSVRVTDGSGNPVQGVQVTFAVASGGGSVTGATPTTNANGVATVGSWTLGAATGPNTLSATAAGDGIAGNPVTFTATAVAGSANTLTIERQPSSSAQSGVVLAVTPQVQVRDANGNAVSQSGIAISATIASGPAGASLTNATATTAGTGLATFNGLTIGGPVGTYTLSFTGPGSSSVTSEGIAVSAGPPSKLVILTQPPATAQAGVVFTQAPVIQVQDAAGNPVSGTRNVSVAIQDGAGTLQGTLSVSTAGGNSVTFGNLRISGATGVRTLLFSSSGLTAVESNNITVEPGLTHAGNSSLAVAPTSVNVGEDATVTVTLRDAFNNLITGRAVTLSSSPNVGATFTPNPATTGGDGVATSTFNASSGGTTTTVSATADGVTLNDTQDVTVVNAPPTGNDDGAFGTNEDASLTIPAPGVLGNDNDPDGGPNPMTAVQFSDPAHGTVVGNANGSFTYTPDANYNGPDSFTYRVSDGSSTSAPATVAITVNAANDRPSFTNAGNVNHSLLLNGANHDEQWVTDVVFGPPDEAGQAVDAYIVDASNPVLFTENGLPAISSTGRLTFTVSGIEGDATIRVSLRDNGGTANGGVDTSTPPAEFTITITAL